MPRIIIKAKVNDAVRWERNFSRKLQQTEISEISAPVDVKVINENEVIATFDADNIVNTFDTLNTKTMKKVMGINSMKLQAGDELMVDDNFDL